MRILILSQVYWPDTASTAQHLADLGRALVAAGHQVTVLASRHGYENPARKYLPTETHDGVTITRLRHTGFGKGAIWKRLLDFGTFNLALLWRLVRIKSRDFELVLGMTSPPLVSFLGARVAAWKRWRFCYWAMDLQPELAIEAGLIQRNSFTAKALEWMGNDVIRRAGTIIALDTYMKRHLISRGAKDAAVGVLPVWPVMQAGWQGPRLANPFRIEQKFGDRFVIMYSGNHAVVHPLETLLQAALRLRDDAQFLFVFIGGGVRSAEVTRFRETYGLTNILQLPYQPRERIHESLTAADLHVVIMGDGQVGYTHPNKVYGAMFIGRPFLYLGPSPSHVTDLMDACPGNGSAVHGRPEDIVHFLQDFRASGEPHWQAVGEQNAAYALQHLTPTKLTEQMVSLVVSTPAS
jgi:colanic acid biosynthesis glycosyl transferase WcaI